MKKEHPGFFRFSFHSGFSRFEIFELVPVHAHGVSVRDPQRLKLLQDSGILQEILEEAEAEASIISAIISRRAELGLSQRDLADLCDIPQSSVARIESSKTTPRLDTLLKLFRQLGLTFNISPITFTK
jgi:DNA-binding XRE family transcriptional regulator